MSCEAGGALGDEAPNTLPPVTFTKSTKTLDSAPGHLNDPRSVEGSLHIIRKADPQETEIQKLYLEISRVVTSPHEVTTLGIHLGIKRHDVTYYVTNYDVRDAAYRFLCWAEDNYTSAEKWKKIVEALTILEKNNTIKELGLEQELTAAKARDACMDMDPENTKF